MRERAINFTDEEIRATLDGRKTQTRRVVNPQPDPVGPNSGLPIREIVPSLLVHRGELFDVRYDSDNPRAIRCPYGAPGDRLWVREAWASGDDELYERSVPHDCWYRADMSKRDPDGRPLPYVADVDEPTKWRSPIHMPRELGRITLEIVSVRVERLQDISEEDAKAEGCSDWIPCGVHTGLKGVRIGGALRLGTFKEYFALLWDRINAKKPEHSWESNPWVWVIEFKRVEAA